MQTKLRHIPYWGSLALLAYMPFHVFLSQWLSSITGGLDYWKGAKDALTFVLLLISIVLVYVYGKRAPKTYWYLCGAGLLYGLLHVLIYIMNKDTSLKLAALATAYNCRLLAYAIIGYSAWMLSREKLAVEKVLRLVLVVSTVVCILGLLQWILPKDIMTHFGYSLERGARSAFFIDDKPDLPRVMSTLRDPNSLGAFLVLPITIIWGTYLSGRLKNMTTLLLGLLALHGLILFLTFSRAGWAGAFISLAAISLYIKKDYVRGLLGRYWPLFVSGVLILAVGAFLLRDQYFVQHLIFHSDENTVSELDSNDYHVSFARQGLEGIIRQPLGHGPGTAGIVSIQKPDGGQLTENYFIQIGYEVGIVGLALLLIVMMLIFRKLKSKNFLAGSLKASFLGFLLIAFITHLWTNEVVAVYWWLLAGMAISKQHKIIKG